MSPRRLCRAEELSAAGGRGFSVQSGAREFGVLRIRDHGRPRACHNRPHIGVKFDWTPRESGLRIEVRVGCHDSDPELAGFAA
jgi:hypothetical protein